MAQDNYDADVIIIGGGPAGSTLATLLGRDGYDVLLIEKDIHPREHVGESLVPSTNLVFDKIGFLDKMNDAGFAHKPGSGWVGPRSPLWKFVDVPLFDFQFGTNRQPYTYNVERDSMDAMLIRHAHENGAKVLQGVQVKEVIFEEDRAVGVRAKVIDGWEKDLRAKLIVDATGRRCLIANQLKMKTKDKNFNQFCMYSWFDNVKPPPDHFEGYSLFYFIGLNQAWGWQFPLRNGHWSIGLVMDKNDFQRSGKTYEEFFSALVARNRTFKHAMEDAVQIRPFWVEGDYSYNIERYAGPGWMLIGDALKFVDPIFSSGVDVALFSGVHAYDTIKEVWEQGVDEETSFENFHTRVNNGVDVWYDLISVFYRLQNLVTRFITTPRYREAFIRALQGNPYDTGCQDQSRKLLEAMEASYERTKSQSTNLLRPWAMDPEKDGSTSCVKCLGIADYVADEHAYICRRCGARLEDVTPPPAKQPPEREPEAREPAA
jgi:1H-pyrrole-2-carbonyl-[peptidyl-carrier protein] chlorinase